VGESAPAPAADPDAVHAGDSPAAADVPPPAASEPTQSQPEAGAAPAPAADALQPSAAAAAAVPSAELAPPLEPQEVIVVGTRLAKTAGAAHIVTEAQLERFEYDDPHAALQQIPGVYVRQEDGIGLRPNIAIRGANPDRSKKITLMEDGILFGPAPYSAPAAYYFPLLTRMTSIRVLEGPSAIAYGPHTVGGAIDFLTRPIPQAPVAALDLAGGEYGYFKAHGYAGTSTDHFGMLIEGVHLHNQGFKELPSGADTGSTRNEWMVKGSYIVDPNAQATNEFTLKLTYSEESSNETYLGLTDADFRADPYRRYPASALDRMDNHRTSLVLKHVLDAPDDHVKLTTSVYRHDYARTWRKLNRFRGAGIAGVLANPDDPTNAEYLSVLRGEVDSSTGQSALYVGPNDRSFVSQGVQSVLQLRDLRSGPIEHRIEVGLRLHNDVIRRHHSEDAFDMLGGELIPVSEASLVNTVNEAQTLAGAAHVLDAMSWGKLMLTPGVRLELIASQLDNRLTSSKADAVVAALMPGVGAFYTILPELGVLAGVYRGFSPPPPGEEGLAPEYSVNYEAGARFTPKHARLEWIGFFNDYSNMTDVCTLSSGCLDDNLDRQFDAGRARIYGFEASASYKVPLPAGASLPLGAAYTWTHAEFRSAFQSADPIYGRVERGDEIPYVPRHQLNVTAGLDLRWLGVNAALTYVSAMREEAGNAPFDESLVTDDLLTLDVGASLQLLSGLTLYANVRNLTDEVAIVSRRPYGARPNPPRWVQVGIKGRLE